LDGFFVQEVRWNKDGTEPADDYTFLYGDRNANHRLGTGFLVHKGNKAAVKRLEFVGDKIYIILRGNLYRIMVLRLIVTL
jgi:hypothetical protein